MKIYLQIESKLLADLLVNLTIFLVVFKTYMVEFLKTTLETILETSMICYVEMRNDRFKEEIYVELFFQRKELCAKYEGEPPF